MDMDFGLFGPKLPKRVTKEEWKKIMSNLYGKLDEQERYEVEKFFRADLDESGAEAGISRAEFDAGMVWLRANQKKHSFSEADLHFIEMEFQKHLDD